MFGRFFGARYYGPRYWGKGGTAPSLQGALSVTEAGDTLSAVGAVPLKGSLAATEAADTLLAVASSATDIVETKPFRRGTYRLRSKRPEEITASDVREAAREIRAEVRADPTSEEVDDLIAELSQAVESLAHIDRLAKSLADLSSAVEFALAEQADEEEASALLLAH